MKSFLNKAYLLSVAILIMATFKVSAQDIIVVEPFTGQPGYVSLSDVVMGDTLADGSRANLNRVYQLTGGGFYPLNGTIDATGFPLVILGEPGTQTTRPPMIAQDVDSEGNHANIMIRCTGDLTIKNILFNGSDITGSPSDICMDVNSNESHVVVDQCYFVNFRQQVMQLIGTSDNSVYFSNNKVYALANSAGEWGQMIFNDNNSQNDTLWVENNTFFNIGQKFSQEGAVWNFFWVNHNTWVNSGHRLANSQLAKELYITENLVLNSSVNGEKVEWFPQNGGGWEAVYGQYDADTLASGPDGSRIFLLDRNNLSESPGFDARYDNYSGNTARLYIEKLGERLKGMIADDVTWPFFKEGVWYDELPGFASDAVVNGVLDQMAEWILEDVMDPLPDPRTAREWDMDGDSNPLTIPWPIPIDLSYSNTTLLTGAYSNLPVGDLNWYPSEKARWETIKDQIRQSIFDQVTSVEVLSSIPVDYKLSQNYPNPFNPSTHIEFSLPKSQVVTLKVFNVLGQEVAELINSELIAGTHKINFDGSNLSSGIYLYKINTENYQKTMKMMLIK